MALDSDQEEIRKYFAEKLKDAREDAGISAEDLGEKTGVGRQYVSLVENGKANFTINHYMAMLDACGTSFRKAISGIQNSDIPTDQQPDHELLKRILKSDEKELKDSIHWTLHAFSEKVVRERQKVRASKAAQQATAQQAAGQQTTAQQGRPPEDPPPNTQAKGSVAHKEKKKHKGRQWG